MRRRRFTVRFDPADELLGGVEPKVVLCYTAEWAREHYERLGYPVIGVEVGDYRVTERTDAGWNFDMAAIREAFEAVSGYALPPQLRLTRGKRCANQRGVFHYTRDKRLAIRVDRTLDRATANRTLWHELCHLKQWLERDGDFDSMRLTDHGVGYRRKSVEVEAREWECLSETDMLLVGGR